MHFMHFGEGKRLIGIRLRSRGEAFDQGSFGQQGRHGMAFDLAAADLVAKKAAIRRKAADAFACCPANQIFCCTFRPPFNRGLEVKNKSPKRFDGQPTHKHWSWSFGFC